MGIYQELRTSNMKVRFKEDIKKMWFHLMSC